MLFRGEALRPVSCSQLPCHEPRPMSGCGTPPLGTRRPGGISWLSARDWKGSRLWPITWLSAMTGYYQCVRSIQPAAPRPGILRCPRSSAQTRSGRAADIPAAWHLPYGPVAVQGVTGRVVASTSATFVSRTGDSWLAFILGSRCTT